MNITRVDLLKGCLIASIGHAIMTNVYPDLSYEQSWDGINYSIISSSGSRCTITFESDYCVGAIRNEKSLLNVDRDAFKKYIRNFPDDVIRKAKEETLQYLLIENDGMLAPCVTSVFWANDCTLFFEKEYINNIKTDFVILDKIVLSKNMAINEWKNYYDMNSNAINLLENLYDLKMSSFDSKIVLSEEQIKLIPGNIINSECIESFKELNIYI